MNFFNHQNFIKQFFKTISMMALSQIIMLAATPLVGRIFAPEQFSVYAIFLSISSIISMGASGRYESTIILANTKEKAISILTFCMLISLVVSLFLFPLIYLFNDYFASWLNLEDSKSYFYLIPLYTWLLALDQILINFLSREEEFKVLSSSRLVRTVITYSIFVLVGWLVEASVTTLMLGSILGILGSHLFVYLKKIRQIDFTSVKRGEFGAIAKEYQNFPKYSMPMIMINVFSQDLLLYALKAKSGALVTGLYTQAYRIIHLPLSLISSAFCPIFYPKLNKLPNKRELYIKSFLANLSVGVLISFPLWFWGREIFGFVMGEKWSESGYYAALISPWAIIRMAAANISFVYDIMDKNSLLLIWQIFYLLFGILIIYLYKDDVATLILTVFTIFGSVMYLIQFVIGYKILPKNRVCQIN